ncbi:SCO3374 family protein [Streptomyces sp. NPDC052701]|uniref:SCO3374 family protein n=1 Tax=Streptomyces sp. NPDC052701 TaxID=3155533 RepID=UPI00342EB092
MVGALPPANAVGAVPLPRRPLDPGGRPGDRVRRWYENELGWPTVPGPAPGAAVRLVVGVRFDVLEVPAEAGYAALGRLGPGSPVAVWGDRMRLLVAAGSAEELPGLLEWLEWGALALDLVAIGAGGLMDAPPPPGPGRPALRPLPLDRRGAPGTALWLRPPVPGCEAGASLPTLSAVGGGGSAPDLVRLVDTVAAQCHRVRLRRACAQPPACRQASRA